MSESWPHSTTVPDGRRGVFDGGSHLHPVSRPRKTLLDRVAAILEAVRNPVFREGDPVAEREWFYGQSADVREGFLLVVVAFNGDGGVIAPTLVNVKAPTERDGELRISWPEAHVQPAELTAALAIQAPASTPATLSGMAAMARGLPMGDGARCTDVEREPDTVARA